MFYVRRRFDKYAEKAEELSCGLLQVDAKIWDGNLLEEKQKILANAILGDYLRTKDLILEALFKLESAVKTSAGWFSSLLPWTKVGRAKRRCVALINRAERKIRAINYIKNDLQIRRWDAQRGVSQLKIREKLSPAIDPDKQFFRQVEASHFKAKFYKPKPEIMMPNEIGAESASRVARLRM